jgi:hypothetical protein
MTRNPFVSAVLLVCCGVGLLAPGDARASPVPHRVLSPDRAWILRDNPYSFAHGAADYSGTVVAVTDTSITILRPTGRPVWPLYTSEGRFAAEVVVRPVPQEPPRRFAVSRKLAAGGAHRPRFVGVAHLLSDVQVGDDVHILYATVGEVGICHQIMITRRPGGFVPPAAVDHTGQYHIIANESEVERAMGIVPRGPKVEPVCRGLAIVDGSYPRLAEEGPWYVRIMIPPPGGTCPFPPARPIPPPVGPPGPGPGLAPRGGGPGPDPVKP